MRCVIVCNTVCLCVAYALLVLFTQSCNMRVCMPVCSWNTYTKWKWRKMRWVDTIRNFDYNRDNHSRCNRSAWSERVWGENCKYNQQINVPYQSMLLHSCIHINLFRTMSHWFCLPIGRRRVVSIGGGGQCIIKLSLSRNEDEIHVNLAIIV